MSAAVVSSAPMMPGLQPLSHNNTSDRDINRLALNLSSNNPFRGRAVSPALPTPRSATSPRSIAPPQSDLRHRMSKNPFLDDAEVGTAVSPPNTINVPADIFNDLSLLDKPNNAPNAKPNGPPPPYATQPGRLPPANMTGSAARSRGPPRPSGSPRKHDVDRQRRPRGMSETSITDKERRDRRERDRENSNRPPRTESEERRRQERRKAREERYRREKESGAKDGKKPRRQQGLDIIDKLDVTGVYGQGLFHHDGPFDACNPHRNARRDRRAPMQAFPANSANMQLGGSGPLNNQIDLDRFHGRGEEAFDAFNSARRRADTMIIDPTSRVEAIHGDETYGLGTSTFLEGAPASRKDLQRLDADDRDAATNGGGLSRKKSLAQKFRGMSSSGRPNRPTGLRSPDTRFNGEVFDTSPPSQVRGGKSVSAGGMARTNYTKENEYNPFDNDYENAYEKKGAQIRVAEQERAAGHARVPSSPREGARGLVRTVTADSADAARPQSNEGESSKTGFLSRMRSLKGGKRARPERRES